MTTYPDDCKKLARFLHETYEEIAGKTGWDTQKSTKVPFDELPEANKKTMLLVAEAIIDEIIEMKPMKSYHLIPPPDVTHDQSDLPLREMKGKNSPPNGPKYGDICPKCGKEKIISDQEIEAHQCLYCLGTLKRNGKGEDEKIARRQGGGTR